MVVANDVDFISSSLPERSGSALDAARNWCAVSQSVDSTSRARRNILKRLTKPAHANTSSRRKAVAAFTLDVKPLQSPSAFLAALAACA